MPSRRPNCSKAAPPAWRKIWRVGSTATFCILCSVNVFAGNPAASCAGVTIASASVAVEYTGIDTGEGGQRPPTVTEAGRGVRVAVQGPPLGSMDSREVRLAISCSRGGAQLVATLTRSAAYVGAVAKNVPWRPIITIEVPIHRPGASVRILWRMFNSDGVELAVPDNSPSGPSAYPTIAEIALP